MQITNLVNDLQRFIDAVDAAEADPTEANIAEAKSLRAPASCGDRSFYAADAKLGQVIFDAEQDAIEDEHHQGGHDDDRHDGCALCPDEAEWNGDPYHGQEPPELEDYMMGLLP